MEQPGGARIVVADTSVLLNFIKIDRLDLFCESCGYRVVITEHVRGEVVDPEQAVALGAAMESGRIEEAAITEPAAQEVFGELSRVIGWGEAAAIALAASRRWAIALDEKGRARREVRERLGEKRLLTTPGVLLRCIRLGVLTVDEADELKAELATKRFRMTFDSFRELLP